MCASWPIHMWDMTHSYVRHDSCIHVSVLVRSDSWALCLWSSYTRSTCVSWLIHVWHDSHIGETWLIQVWDMTHSCLRHDSKCCPWSATWLTHMWDMTHAYVRHDSCMCDRTHSYMWHDSFMSVTWLILRGDMTHTYVWPDSFISMTWLVLTCDVTGKCLHLKCTSSKNLCNTKPWRHDSFICMTWRIHMYNRSHVHVRHDSFIWVSWLQTFALEGRTRSNSVP